MTMKSDWSDNRSNHRSVLNQGNAYSHAGVKSLHPIQSLLRCVDQKMFFEVVQCVLILLGLYIVLRKKFRARGWGGCILRQGRESLHPVQKSKRIAVQKHLMNRLSSSCCESKTTEKFVLIVLRSPKAWGWRFESQTTL
jgi:hypothetical protein